MITYQYESEYVFNQYGCHDCLVNSLVVACVKIIHLGSPRCERFDLSIHIAIFRGCESLT